MNNMSIIKLIFVAIVASSSVLDIVQAGGDYFHEDQYLGVWYTIGATLKMISSGDILCDWTEVTKFTGDVMTFLEVGRLLIDGKPMKNIGYGRIQNSEIHTVFPSYQNSEEIFTVTSYNDGRDLILHDTSNGHYHILMSRDTTPSTEAIKALEQHAAKSNHRAIYVSHEGCEYRRY